MLKVKNGLLLSHGSAVEQVKSKNTGGPFAAPPKIVVIHFTAGGSAKSSANWFSSPQNTNSSAHVVIERDGSIIQCVSFDTVAWHAGKSSWRGLNGLNKHSIGIELANWGALKGVGSDWVNAAGQKIADPFLGVHRNGNPDGSRKPIGWEAYPKAQFDAAADLVTALAGSYPIAEIVGHDDIAPVRKSDPGPAFDMVKFRNCVFGARRDDGPNSATVRSPGGLNLRTGPGMSFTAIELLADGTRLEPIGVDGVWLEVTVLGTDHQPVRTGWVHSRFVSMD